MNRSKLTFSFIAILAILLMAVASCSNQKEEEIILDDLLPEGAIKELTYNHPDFKIFFVSEKNANVSVTFEEKSIRVDGVEDEERREKFAAIVMQYLENPNKAAEDKAKKDAYNALPPKEKMDAFVKRMKEHYPEFAYEWVGLGEGNVKVEYGDNSLIISGVEDENGREEIAHGVMQIQKEIDKVHPQEE